MERMEEGNGGARLQQGPCVKGPIGWLFDVCGVWTQCDRGWPEREDSAKDTSTGDSMVHDFILR